MAKNITHNKRISQNKYEPDRLVVNPKSGCPAKIVNDMDSNLISNNLTTLADSPIRKGQNLSSGTNILIDKRRLMDKKFPLMEKSQKIMKHLTHNRQMPKPRAHLASLPQSLLLVDTKKSETRKKISNNSMKIASTRRESKTTNIASSARDNVKKSESNRKKGNNLRKVTPNKSVTNKTSKTSNKVKKSETKRKVNNSRKLSQDLDPTYQISPWLRKSKVSTLEERDKNKRVIEKNDTVIAKKCLNQNTCFSDSDITDDIRSECSGSEDSDSDFEKFVKIQTKDIDLKKRRKKQPATGQKKIKQKPPIQKDVKRGATIKSSSQYGSDSVVRRNKRRKVNNKGAKHESIDIEYDNDNTEDASDDESVFNVPNTVSTQTESYEQPVTSEKSASEVKNNLVSNKLSASNPNTNFNLRGSSSNEPQNERVLTNVKSSRVRNNLKVDGLSATHSGAMFDSISCSRQSVPESAEKSVLIDLSLSDNECEPTTSIPRAKSTKILQVKKAATRNLKNASNSDDESDLEIVDVVLSEEKLVKVKDDKRNVGSTNNIKIEKATSLALDKTQNPPKICPMQKGEMLLKHEAAFSTNVCQRPAEANLNSAPITSNKNVVINQREVKETYGDDDDDIIELSDQTASATLPGSSQISPSNANVKHEILARKRENPIENVTNARNSVPSKEKLLYEIACYNVKTLIPNDKPTKFSSLSAEDMNTMDVTTLLQMFKTEFQTYQEIIETQESIGYTFKQLENRQAEKLKSLKDAIQKYIDSFECSGINSSNFDFSLGTSGSKPQASNPERSSLCSNTIRNPDVGRSQLKASFK